MCRGVRNWPFVPEAESLLSKVLVHVPLEVVTIVRGKVHVFEYLARPREAWGGHRF